MDAERDLLEQARRLDEGALGAIFDEYYTPLYRYIYHHVGHTETAQDLTAQVFQRLLEHLHAGRGPQHRLKPWLFRVAHNLVVDESRRLVHRNHLSLEEHLLADGASVDEQARQSILTTEARQALRSLTPKQRSVIVLKYLDGMDNAEVARILRLPIGAVKSLQNRALAALRRELSRASAWIAEGETV